MKTYSPQRRKGRKGYFFFDTSRFEEPGFERLVHINGRADDPLRQCLQNYLLRALSTSAVSRTEA